MKEKEISDDEIQILGLEYKEPEVTPRKSVKLNNYTIQSADQNERPGRNKRWTAWLSIVILLIVATIAFLVFLHSKSKDIKATPKIESSAVQLDAYPEEAASKGYIEVSDETINDVPLRIYIPRNAIPELSLSLPDETDSTIVFVYTASDVGENDYGILDDYVLKGKVLAKGVRKEGFCSIINNTLTVGVSPKTPLLQDAIQEKGYFFRQYPLVSNSKAIDNKPKGKSVRRALAIRKGDIIMIESLDRESFHDFAQALADSGVSDAIYLAGGIAVCGWYRDKQGKQTFFGTKKDNFLKGVNFIVWRNK